MPQTDKDKDKPHGEKEQMTEPQDEFIGQKSAPSKDVSEIPPEQRKEPPEKAS